MQASKYSLAARELLDQATQELASGDAGQASEKAWDAAAQIVKAVAEKEGWYHRSHASLYQVVGQVSQNTGDPQFLTLFHVAGNLHTNFYEDWFASDIVASGLRDVETLLNKLEPLLRT